MRDRVVDRYRDEPPSLVMHIFPTHFKFEHQDGVFLLSGIMKDFLGYIKERKLPPDLIDVFEEAKCPFYEGCIIVEVHDHRRDDEETPDKGTEPECNASDTTSDASVRSSKQQSTTKAKSTNDKLRSALLSVYRIALHPTPECVWSDVCMMNEQIGTEWSDDMALELESRILLATSPPLCLDPSMHVSRISNVMCRAETRYRPTAKRKWNSSEVEEVAAAQAESEKLMLMMDEKHMRPFQPSFARVNYMQDWRRKRAKIDAEPSTTLETPGHSNSEDRNTKDGDNTQQAGRKLICTMRFEQGTREPKKHVLLNIYSTPSQNYEGLLRWGTVRDTSINGQSASFIIGDDFTMRLYMFGIKRFMEIDHRLVFEQNLTVGSGRLNVLNMRSISAGTPQERATVAALLAQQQAMLHNPPVQPAASTSPTKGDMQPSAPTEAASAFAAKVALAQSVSAEAAPPQALSQVDSAAVNDAPVKSEENVPLSSPLVAASTRTTPIVSAAIATPSVVESSSATAPPSTIPAVVSQPTVNPVARTPVPDAAAPVNLAQHLNPLLVRSLQAQSAAAQSMQTNPAASLLAANPYWANHLVSVIQQAPLNSPILAAIHQIQAQAQARSQSQAQLQLHAHGMSQPQAANQAQLQMPQQVPPQFTNNPTAVATSPVVMATSPSVQSTLPNQQRTSVPPLHPQLQQHQLQQQPLRPGMQTAPALGANAVTQHALLSHLTQLMNSQQSNAATGMPDLNAQIPQSAAGVIGAAHPNTAPPGSPLTLPVAGPAIGGGGGGGGGAGIGHPGHIQLSPQALRNWQQLASLRALQQQQLGAQLSQQLQVPQHQQQQQTPLLQHWQQQGSLMGLGGSPQQTPQTVPPQAPLNIQQQQQQQQQQLLQQLLLANMNRGRGINRGGQ